MECLRNVSFVWQERWLYILLLMTRFGRTSRDIVQLHGPDVRRKNRGQRGETRDVAVSKTLGFEYVRVSIRRLPHKDARWHIMIIHEHRLILAGRYHASNLCIQRC